MNGLPAEIADLLIACEELPLREIVTKANKLFTAQTSRMPQRVTHEPLPIATTQVPRSVAAHNIPYCFYYRSQRHLTSECRERPTGNVCWCCHRPDHTRRTCPFREGQEEAYPPAREQRAQNN